MEKHCSGWLVAPAAEAGARGVAPVAVGTPSQGRSRESIACQAPGWSNNCSHFYGNRHAIQYSNTWTPELLYPLEGEYIDLS